MQNALCASDIAPMKLVVLILGKMLTPPQPFEQHNRLLKSDDYLRAKIEKAGIDVSDLLYTTHALPQQEIQSRIRAAQVERDMQVRTALRLLKIVDVALFP